MLSRKKLSITHKCIYTYHQGTYVDIIMYTHTTREHICRYDNVRDACYKDYIYPLNWESVKFGNPMQVGELLDMHLGYS